MNKTKIIRIRVHLYEEKGTSALKTFEDIDEAIKFLQKLKTKISW